jgi:large subunit ribosomal protein L13
MNPSQTSKTTLPKVSEIKRQWLEIDASKHSLGRLASRIATLLRGKHKVSFTPHMDVGDFVVVINAKQIKVTGRKLIQKKYHRFSGYPGGITTTILRDALLRSPRFVIHEAVRRMLPTNRLRTPMLKRMKVIDEDKHTFKIDKKLD